MSALDGPYIGLNFYTQENAAVFFGRDSERTALISNLRAARLTLVYAGSGTGKSSLLRAGVAASLADLAQRNFAQRGAARSIPVVFSFWRDDPAAGLIGEIQKAISPFLPAGAPSRPEPDRLETAIEAANETTGATLLVILDQFEDYLLYQAQEAWGRPFADDLAACINRADLRVNFLISIREDAYFALGDVFKGRISNVYGNYFRLEHLSREAAREAIEKPVATFNALHADRAAVEIEPGLADAVLDQFGPDQPGPVRDDAGGTRRCEVHASYLQLVMKRLWDIEQGKGSGRLRLRTLDGLGGAETIVRTHVERALGGLAEGERQAAAAIFHHLVTPSGAKIALTASDLAAYSRRPAADTGALLERLASSDIRILRPVPPPPGRTDGTRFEIAHDLLIAPIQRWDSRYNAARQEREKEADRQATVTRSRLLRFAVSSPALVSALVVILGAILTIATTLILNVTGITGGTPKTGGTASTGLAVTLQIPAVSAIQAGSGILGHVSLISRAATTRQVRLTFTSNDANAVITGPAGVVAVPAGKTSSAPISIRFLASSTGLVSIRVEVVDAANPGLVYSEATANVTVTGPPGFYARYQWEIIGALAAVLLAFLAALWQHAAYRRRVDVRGLVVILRRNGEQMGLDLRPPARWSDSFPFIIRDEFEPAARLDYPQPGSPPYMVRRSGNGEVTLITPEGEWYVHVVVGGPGQRMSRNGLELAFRDRRRPDGPQATPAGRPAEVQISSRPSQPDAAGLVPSLPPQDDPWL